MSTGDGPHPNVALDTALVRRLLSEQFPEWADLPMTPVRTPGMDNMTFRLGADKLVRLPRFPRWVGQVEREQRWLPHLAPRLPLAVPEPLAQGDPNGEYPFPWSVYGWIDGEPPTAETLRDEEEAALTLAGFFLALRGADAAGGPPPEWSNGFRGVPVDSDADSAIVAWRLHERIGALTGLVDTDALTAVWRSALDAPPWGRPPVWVHGDPAPGNLLAKDGRLCAVIDFGTLAVGDPAIDLIAAWTLLGDSGRAAFRDAARIDHATWARGRAWALSALLPSPDELSPSDPARAARARSGIDAVIADHRGTA